MKHKEELNVIPIKILVTFFMDLEQVTNIYITSLNLQDTQCHFQKNKAGIEFPECRLYNKAIIIRIGVVLEQNYTHRSTRETKQRKILRSVGNLLQMTWEHEDKCRNKGLLKKVDSHVATDIN